jgi:hypothetical protein
VIKKILYDEGVKKKAPGRIFRGLFCRVLPPLEDSLNVFQHTSPERLVRVMVMMVVELNAIHNHFLVCLGNRHTGRFRFNC